MTRLVEPQSLELLKEIRNEMNAVVVDMDIPYMTDMGHVHETDG